MGLSLTVCLISIPNILSVVVPNVFSIVICEQNVLEIKSCCQDQEKKFKKSRVTLGKK